MQRSARNVVLVDHSKIGGSRPRYWAELPDGAQVVTDSSPGAGFEGCNVLLA